MHHTIGGLGRAFRSPQTAFLQRPWLPSLNPLGLSQGATGMSMLVLLMPSTARGRTEPAVWRQALPLKIHGLTMKFCSGNTSFFLTSSQSHSVESLDLFMFISDLCLFESSVARQSATDSGFLFL